MFNGVNILGHSAPFPTEVPSLLINLLKPGSVILDPFSGSMTTGKVAFMHEMYSINIDYKKEYCELGLSLLQKELTKAKQLSFLI